eukprot:scaffold325_cov343-Pavlova_lutheri.AAC.3
MPMCAPPCLRARALSCVCFRGVSPQREHPQHPPMGLCQRQGDSLGTIPPSKGKDVFPVPRDGSVPGKESRGIEGAGLGGRDSKQAGRCLGWGVVATGGMEWPWRWTAWERGQDDEAPSHNPASMVHHGSLQIRRK